MESAGATGGRFAAIALALFVVMALALIVAGCGGGSDTSGPELSTLEVTYAAFPDYLDPSLSYSLEGWSAMWETYIPLLTYAHADGAAGTKVIPGLARALPKITDGGHTYTLFLRKGLRYSDGTPVRASDFRATIERMLAMDSPGSPFYTDIVGAEHFAETKKGGIPGIATDDASGRIVIHLVHPAQHLHQRAGDALRRAAAAGTKREDLSADPPPGTAPTRSSRSARAAAGNTGATRSGRSTTRRLLPQVAGRPLRRDRRPGDRQPGDRGERRRERQDRLDAGAAAARPLRRTERALRRHASC